MRKIVIAALTAVLVGALGGIAAAQESTSDITVVHGVPGLPVDIYVNGELTIENFQPGDVAGPLQLPAGNYDFAITAVGDSIDNAVLEGSQAVPSGINATVIAHLDTEGNPAVGTFVNDVSDPGDGNGRLVVRHTAAAPAVDILLADGTEVFTGLSNPNEDTADLPADTYSVAIAPAGEGVDAAVFGPADVEVPAGNVRVVYAIGALADGSFDLVIQDIAIAAASEAADEPAAVPSGSGDLAGTGFSVWAIALAALAAAAIAGSIRLAVSRTR